MLGKFACAQIGALYLLGLAMRADTQTPLAVVRLNPAALESPSVTRYLNHGQYRFCLEKNTPGLISMVVEDSRGNRVASVDRNKQCEQRTLHSGSYRFALGYDAARLGSRTMAFLRYKPFDIPVPPLVDADGQPVGGYWAVAPASAATNPEIPGRLRGTPPYTLVYGSQVIPVIADQGGFSYGDYALFKFSDLNDPIVFTSQGDQHLSIFAGSNDPGLVGVQSPNSGPSHFAANPLSIKDLGQTTFTATANLPGNLAPLSIRPTSDAGPNTLGFTAASPATQFSVRFRYYPDGTQIGKLNPGEAAIYQQCNYQGRAIVFWGSLDLQSLTSAATTLAATGLSVRLGDGILVTGQSQGSVNGQPPPTAIITTDAPCLSRPLDRYVSAITPIFAIFFDINCPNCDFSDRDLSQTDLSGFDLHGSNFTGSSLAQASLQGANLTSAKFNGANLNGAQLQNAQFIGADLTGATIANTTLTGTDFTAATLHGLNFANFELVKTRFSGADLSSANLSGAKLYSAQLDNANLDGANMAGVFLTKAPSVGDAAANLQGAFLRNVNLSASRISGADFTNASFFSTTAVGTSTCVPDLDGFTNGCATAAGSVMDLTDFSSAYLFGVDFTNTTMQGVDFSNAILSGANFNNAALQPDSSGAVTNFTQAFLQGTNLTGAIISTPVSLQNAFVDFSSAGNTINLILAGAHTLFPSYWGSAGEPVCAQLVYNNATQVPATAAVSLCPDGGQYADGCGAPTPDGSNLHWKSLVDITPTASYLNNSTYVNAPSSGNPVCNADLRWIPIDFAQSKKH